MHVVASTHKLRNKHQSHAFTLELRQFFIQHFERRRVRMPDGHGRSRAFERRAPLARAFATDCGGILRIIQKNIARRRRHMCAPCRIESDAVRGSCGYPQKIDRDPAAPA